MRRRAADERDSPVPSDGETGVVPAGGGHRDPGRLRRCLVARPHPRPSWENPSRAAWSSVMGFDRLHRSLGRFRARRPGRRHRRRAGAASSDRGGRPGRHRPRAHLHLPGFGHLPAEPQRRNGRPIRSQSTGASSTSDPRWSQTSMEAPPHGEPFRFGTGDIVFWSPR